MIHWSSSCTLVAIFALYKNKTIKGAEDLSEDDVRYFEEEVQKWTNKNSAKIDELTKAKEKDLMTI